MRAFSRGPTGTDVHASNGLHLLETLVPRSLRSPMSHLREASEVCLLSPSLQL